MGLKAFIEILRPANCFMAAIAVFIGYVVAIGKIWFETELFFAMASAFLICGAGQVINDFFDVRIDEKIRPQKILPSKKMKVQTALFYSAALFGTGLILASQINMPAFLIAFSFTVLLALYSAVIQKQKFLGNIVVALGTAFTIIFGASIVQNYNVAIFLATSAFFSNMGREITKDVQDKEADKGHKTTLAMILTQNQVNIVVLAFYALAFLTAFFVWQTKMIQSNYYLLLLIVSGGLFLYSFVLLLQKQPGKAQLFSKIAMVFSLLAFISGVF